MSQPGLDSEKCINGVNSYQNHHTLKGLMKRQRKSAATNGFFQSALPFFCAAAPSTSGIIIIINILTFKKCAVIITVTENGGEACLAVSVYPKNTTETEKLICGSRLAGHRMLQPSPVSCSYFSGRKRHYVD